ncbi:MAG: hypothetical protein JWN23_1572 [Rhodocyclales bacterium]|nr:hypothetical protein [Rhodocyclales bacterium]
MMLCSHSIPTGNHCQQCFDEGMSREDVIAKKEGDISALRARIDELQRVAEFYAEDANWKRPTNGRRWRNSVVAKDRGSRARSALFGLGE